MAEQKYYTLLTTIGKASIANATALGNKVDLVKLQLGDGAGAEYNPTEEQTSLKNVVWEGSINNVKIDEENPNWIVIETVIPGSVGGFMIREVGIFDSKEQLIAVSKYPETYKPTADSGSVKDLVIKIILVVSNTSSVNLKVDPTVILATLKDIQDLDSKIDTTKTELTSNIETAKTELNTKIGDTTQLTTTDKTNIVNALNEVKTSVDSIETTAEKTSIKDIDNLFESDNVEGALNQLAINYNILLEKQDNLETEVNGQRIKGISIANSLIDMI
ncbi:TPA: phage tail protein [Clostridioides difficile]|uniref:phage tail protein n=4 Tax=Clostridioides difficile TaxID=1496 RepID=UPI00038D0A46|nr:phage tail protein [Clostridioides difficile]EAA0010526.1 phage tail protein [Clostridioides difficile]EGT3661368.1 phage tail protein [Clostridioides difficile]EGT3779675.1 phage tail protein [Clostridioides difficile]EGT3820396.1 phage tail protein [Clostridioides difficile]EGT3856592.1 phage tail protein [Clostridioides difficile]